MKTATIERKVIEVLPAGTISGTKPAPKDTKESKDVKATDDLMDPDGSKNTVFQNLFARNIIPDKPIIPVKTKIRKSTKGQKKTSDYIDYDVAFDKGRELLWKDKTMVIGFYVIFAINTGLRVSDVMNIKHSDLSDLRPGDYLNVTEHKTKKVRKIQVNDKIFEAYKYLSGKLTEQRKYNPEGFVFTSQKTTVFATVSINRILKTVFAGKARNVSTHSLRKSFGRRVYEANKRSEHSLILLSDIFQHSNTAITRRYLGLRQEEIDNVYLNL